MDRESLLSLTETLQTLIKYTLNFFWTAELSVDKIYFKSLAESLIYKSHLSQFLTARAIVIQLLKNQILIRKEVLSESLTVLHPESRKTLFKIKFMISIGYW